ncbi:MAG TPA: hypothetical protein VFG07_08935 [Thermoplasmata archaeon]|nr:hypothetical protein [Thermoplasmata archaeon]
MTRKSPTTPPISRIISILLIVVTLMVASTFLAFKDAFEIPEAPPTTAMTPHGHPLVSASTPSPRTPFWNNTTVEETETFNFGPLSSPWGSFGLTYAFGGVILLTGGAIDSGTERGGEVRLETPAYSLLNITVASHTVSVPLPNLLGIDQSLNVATLDLQLEVPYLGILTLASFSLSIVISVVLEATSSVVGCGTGAGEVMWDSSGARQVSTCAAGLHPGEIVSSTLSNLRFALAAGVQAEATIADVFTDTIPILPLTPIMSVAAPVSLIDSSYTVVSPPSHLHSYVTPNPATDGEAVQLLSSVSGGAGVISYSYLGSLPGSGCSDAGPGVIACTATEQGNFSLQVEATDQQGVRTLGYANYTETAPPGPDYNGLSGWSTLSVLQAGTGLLMIVIAVELVVILIQGRRS